MDRKTAEEIIKGLDMDERNDLLMHIAEQVGKRTEVVVWEES